MPRRDDDSGEYRKPKKGPGIALWVALGGVLVTLALCGGGGTIVALWAKGNAAATLPAENRVYTRDDFRTLVVGKTEAEVIAAVGRPDRTSDGYWYYSSKTFDTVTGKTDFTAQLVFGKSGVVEKVNCH